jgi:hypothetical protein
MPACPSCRRPVAVKRASCLYCGAPLPEGGRDAVEPRVTAGPDAAARPARTLLVLDLAGAGADALADALERPSYEAGLLARRGGFHLVRALPPAAAAQELARLQAAGLRAYAVPEAEARVRPTRAHAGEARGATLQLRTAEGRLEIDGDDLLVVVAGPIARARQAGRFDRRRPQTPLDDGYRFHLHRRAHPAPVEIDPFDFEPGFAPSGAVRLELESWLDRLGGAVPRDLAFGRLPPALGAAEAPREGALAPERLAPRGRRDEPLLLDNVEQFRFYSGWRAAVERRRGEP